jgi:hypothetical protein
VFVIHETTLKLESCNLVDLVICWCKKYQQLARQEGKFVACFLLNILMVHSSTLAITTDDEHLTCGGFYLSETIRFESLEFIAGCFGNLSLSSKGSDSDAVFVRVNSITLPLFSC